MKTTLSLLILVLNVAIALGAETTNRVYTFRVNGYGKVFYSPDRFDLSFAVVTEDPDVSRCKESHLATLNKLKSFLDQQQKTLVSLRQDATTLNRIYRMDTRPEQRVFRYSTSFSARLQEASALTPFQEGIVTAGVTDLYGLDLFSARQAELLDEARREAIKDAKRKAELAARELGWKLQSAIDITFTEGSWRANPRASVNFGSRTSVAQPQGPADLSTFVDSEVSIVFQFDPRLP